MVCQYEKILDTNYDVQITIIDLTKTKAPLAKKAMLQRG